MEVSVELFSVGVVYGCGYLHVQVLVDVVVVEVGGVEGDVVVVDSEGDVVGAEGVVAASKVPVAEEGGGVEGGVEVDQG